MGTVYGNPSDFTRKFTGTYMQSIVSLVIENDGRIRLEQDGGSGAEYGTNLSRYIEMPGKIIKIRKIDGGYFTSAVLAKFIDASGKSPADYFTVVEER